MRTDKLARPAVAGLSESQCLVYLIWNKSLRLYLTSFRRNPFGRPGQWAADAKQACWYFSREDAIDIRNRLEMPERYTVVPAVYDCLDDSVSHDPHAAG